MALSVKSLMKVAVLMAAVAVLFCASSCSAQTGTATPPSSASPPTPSVATPSESPPSKASPSDGARPPTTDSKTGAAPATGITWTAMILSPALLLCLWLPLLLA